MLCTARCLRSDLPVLHSGLLSDLSRLRSGLPSGLPAIKPLVIAFKLVPQSRSLSSDLSVLPGPKQTKKMLKNLDAWVKRPALVFSLTLRWSGVMLRTGLSGILLFAVASIAQAYDFTAADELFAQRAPTEEGAEAISEALAAYHAALDTVTGDEKLYAVAQISRLYIYDGDMTRPESDKKARMRIFDKCLDTLKAHIHPDEVGATPQYYYYKVYCLALWGKAAGPLRILLRAVTLKRAIREGLKLDTRYEGGGLPRMVGAVYLNSKARPIGLYKPEQALTLIEQAIASEGVEDRAYPEIIAGADVAENYYHYAEALLKNDRKPEAIELLEQTVAEYEELIELEALPVGREPETRYYLEKLRKRLVKYTSEQ